MGWRATLPHTITCSLSLPSCKAAYSETFSVSCKLAEKTFMDCSLVVPPNCTMPPNFVEKIFANSYKTLKVSCYAEICNMQNIAHYTLQYTYSVNIAYPGNLIEFCCLHCYVCELHSPSLPLKAQLTLW